MNDVDPKVKASATTALVVSLVMAFLVSRFPSLGASTPLVQGVVVAVVTAVLTLAVGFYRKAVGWAHRYVTSHEEREASPVGPLTSNDE